MSLSIEAVATLLVAMFVVSGATKVLTFGASEAGRFAERTGVALASAARIVFLAGVWELVASALVLRGVWSLGGVRGRAALESVNVGASALVVFTALATVIFYVHPFKFKPVLANLTTMAGLMLLPRVCDLKRN